MVAGLALEPERCHKIGGVFTNRRYKKNSYSHFASLPGCLEWLVTALRNGILCLEGFMFVKHTIRKPLSEADLLLKASTRASIQGYIISFCDYQESYIIKPYYIQTSYHAYYFRIPVAR